MKARRVLAPSLFPYTSSRLNSSNPTPPCRTLHYLQHLSPKTCPSPLCRRISFPFSVFSTEFNYRRTDLKLKTEKCVGEVAEPHRVFFLFIRHRHHFHPRFDYSYFTLLFLSLCNRSFFFHSPCCRLTAGLRRGYEEFPRGPRMVRCSYLHMPSFSFCLFLAVNPLS